MQPGEQRKRSVAPGLAGRLVVQKPEPPLKPDLNDGVRLNIRPFVEAGVLRAPFNIHWRKDRGKNPDGTERLNDIHPTQVEKLDARRNVGRL